MEQNTIATLVPTFLPLIAIFVIFYFFMIKPQKKKEKEIKDMRSNLKVGDNILTIGGIYGKIVLLKEDYVVIETSGDKTKMEMTKWAIGSVVKDKSDLSA